DAGRHLRDVDVRELRRERVSRGRVEDAAVDRAEVRLRTRARGGGRIAQELAVEEHELLLRAVRRRERRDPREARRPADVALQGRREARRVRHGATAGGLESGERRAHRETRDQEAVRRRPGTPMFGMIFFGSKGRLFVASMPSGPLKYWPPDGAFTGAPKVTFEVTWTAGRPVAGSVVVVVGGVGAVGVVPGPM